MRFLLWMFLVIGTFSSIAQNSLSGQIRDEDTNEPLIGATLYFPDLKKGTVTDLNGRYKIEQLPAGTFLAEAKYIGYRSKVVPVAVRGATEFDVLLSSTPTEMHEIVVTGVSASTELRRNPVSTKVINGDALRETNSTNIVDAISNQPGVSQISTGQAISKPVIRGLSSNRVIALYNGVRQEGQQWGDEHGLEVDEYGVDRVEIVKGPGSLMYGSDGIGGVVNFLTPNPQPEGKIIGNVVTNYQSNNNLLGISLMNAGTINHINWLIRASGKQAGNYKNGYDGRVYNSGFHEIDYNGYLGISKSWGYSQLQFSSFNQSLALPEGERDEDGHFTKPTGDDTFVTVSEDDLSGYKIGIPSQRVRHHRLFLANNFIVGDSRITANVGYQLNQRQEFGNAENPDDVELGFYMPTLNYDVKYFFPDFNGWKISAGVGGMGQSNENKGEEFLIPDYTLFDIGMFAVFQKWFYKLNVSGGLRYDHRSVSASDLFLDDEGAPAAPSTPDATQKFKGFDNTYGNYSGSIGATYNISDAALIKANISRGYRAPNLSELSSNGRHEGTFRYEVGEVNLKPEISLQLDAGFSLDSDHVSLEADFFHNTIDDYIYALRLESTNGGDSIADPSDPAPVYKYSQNLARLYGGEIRVDIHPHPLDWLHFENTFSLVRGVNQGKPDSSKYLPFIPAPKFQTELRATRKVMGSFLSNTFAKVSLDYYFEQNQYLMENNTETLTPAYALLHASIGGDVANRDGDVLFTLLISANNILDKSYQSHLSRLKYAPENPVTGRTGVFNMGRNISFKLIVPVQFRKAG